MTGIYCIENNVNGKKYIGQAKDIQKRWKLHKAELRRGNHYNEHLQRAWNMYGPDAFSFYVLEICDVSSLSEREIFFIKHHGSFENGYNMTEGGEGTRGCKHTQEYKDKMRSLFKDRVFSEATLRRMSEAKKGKPQTETESRKNGRKIVSEKLKGKKFSEEHRRNLSQAMKGRTAWNKGMTFPPEYSPMYGKHLSEETKKKIGDANRGRKKTEKELEASSKKVVCVETGEIYPSISSAARNNGVSLHAISNVLRGKARTSAGFHWEYLEGSGKS